jgi:type IV secretory pathway VirB4 component
VIDLRNDGLSSNQMVTLVFHPDTAARHDVFEALALTQLEFDSVRRPSATGWRHFLRLQGLDLAHAEFDLKIAAETLTRLAWTPNDFLELLARVHADVGRAPSVALPALHLRLLGHLSQMKDSL